MTIRATDHRRIRRLIRPTPRPTKDIRTNMRIRGSEVIAVAKSPVHPIEAVTRELTFSIRVAIVTVAVVRHSPFLKNYQNSDPNHRPEESNDTIQHPKTNKSRNRFRKQKIRELHKEPKTKIHHLLHKIFAPILKVQ